MERSAENKEHWASLLVDTDPVTEMWHLPAVVGNPLLPHHLSSFSPRWPTVAPEIISMILGCLVEFRWDEFDNPFEMVKRGMANASVVCRRWEKSAGSPC